MVVYTRYYGSTGQGKATHTKRVGALTREVDDVLHAVVMVAQVARASGEARLLVGATTVSQSARSAADTRWNGKRIITSMSSSADMTAG